MGMDFRKGHERAGIGEPQRKSMFQEEAGQIPGAPRFYQGAITSHWIKMHAEEACRRSQSRFPLRQKDVLPFRSHQAASKRIALGVSARASGSGAHDRQHSYTQPLVVPLPIQGVKQMIPSQQPLPIPVVEEMIPS